jgi:hypothetical protein
MSTHPHHPFNEYTQEHVEATQMDALYFCCCLACLYLLTIYPLEKPGTRSMLYEPGYMGPPFIQLIYAGAALGGVITGVQQLHLWGTS